MINENSSSLEKSPRHSNLKKANNIEEQYSNEGYKMDDLISEALPTISEEDAKT
jgi:hypothetical protein